MVKDEAATKEVNMFLNASLSLLMFCVSSIASQAFSLPARSAKVITLPALVLGRALEPQGKYQVASMKRSDGNSCSSIVVRSTNGLGWAFLGMRRGGSRGRGWRSTAHGDLLS